MAWLTLGFLLTALLYASIGFGGGSTYNALLALAETDYRILPALSLVCNIIVVTGGTIRFACAGLLPWRRALPLVLISAPFAWVGGLTPIKETSFLAILAIALAASGLLLLLQKQAPLPDDTTRKAHGGDIVIGALTGYLAGLVGIGGGIFLAPWLHATRWAGPRTIAAMASFFIFVNSASGLVSQSLKLAGNGQDSALLDYWPLALSVLAGGTIGTYLGVRLLPATLLKRLTGVLVLYVAGQLAWKLLRV